MYPRPTVSSRFSWWTAKSIFPVLSLGVAHETDKQSKAMPMARKSNYEFKRRERDRLKGTQEQRKTSAKKEAKQRTKTTGPAAALNEDVPNENSSSGRCVAEGQQAKPEEASFVDVRL